MLEPTLVNGTALSPVQDELPTVQVDGRGLAYGLRGKTAEQRALLAQDWLAQPHSLINPTAAQICAVHWISRYQLHQASELTDDEWLLVYLRRRRLSTKTSRLKKLLSATDMSVAV